MSEHSGRDEKAELSERVELSEQEKQSEPLDHDASSKDLPVQHSRDAQAQVLTCDAVVLGDSVSAIQSALDLAEVGLSVIVVADPARSAWPDTSQRDPEGHIAGFIHRVAQPVSSELPERSELRVSKFQVHRNFVFGGDGVSREISYPETLGLPGVPLNAATSALLGGGAAFRAYLDRIAPVLSVGKQPSIWKLASSRMGKRAAELLLRPFLADRFGVDVELVETQVAAPGLNEALTRAGALSGAVLALTDRWRAHETRVEPETGWLTLRDAALKKLELFQAAVIDSAVAKVAQVSQTAEPVEKAEAAAGPAGPAGTPRAAETWRVVLANGQIIEARALIADRVHARETSTVDPNAAAHPNAASGTNSASGTNTASELNTAASTVETAVAQISVPGEPVDAEHLHIRPVWMTAVSKVTGESAEASLAQERTKDFWNARWHDPHPEDPKKDNDRTRESSGDAGQVINLLVPDVIGKNSSLRVSYVLDRDTSSTDFDNRGTYAFMKLGTDVSDVSVNQLDEVLETVGAKRQPGAVWRRVDSARPLSSIDQVNLAEKRMRNVHSEHESLIVTGELWHGGQLGEALAHAHEQAVRLRRFLTGIAD